MRVSGELPISFPLQKSVFVFLPRLLAHGGHHHKLCLRLCHVVASVVRTPMLWQLSALVNIRRAKQKRKNQTNRPGSWQLPLKCKLRAKLKLKLLGPEVQEHQ